MESPHSSLSRDNSHDSLSDAEKGLYDSTAELIAPHSFVYLGQKRKGLLDPHLLPNSPVHDGITPLSSVPNLALLRTASELRLPDAVVPKQTGWPVVDSKGVEVAIKKPTPPKRKVSRWILFQLWFNTYRKLFTFVTLLNLTGIILAALGKFPYAVNHLGALVLGNLLCAILFRTEVWMRGMYLICIYGTKWVCYHPPYLFAKFSDQTILVGTVANKIRRDVFSAACRRHSFRLRALWCFVSRIV